MSLAAMQKFLTRLYGIDLGFDVHDFLITDHAMAAALGGRRRETREELLIAESGDEAAVSLFLDPDLVERLERNDPTSRLDAGNLADFWTAFEGVSHFTYFVFNANRDRCVTLLEMELQAEVDKFVATLSILKQQLDKPPRELHGWLFDAPRFDRELDNAELERYERANRYAARYCRRLWSQLSGRPWADGLTRELRRFYRLPRAEKIGHIGL
jgi:hypothetical protein